VRDRRKALIRRCGGQLTERQALAVDMVVAAEWAVTVAEHEAEAANDPRDRITAMRVAGDARKQVLLWNRELNASLAPAAPVEPTDPVQALHRHLAERQREAVP
jgi:hypothetical protein